MKSSSAYTGKPMSLGVSQQLNELLPVQQDHRGFLLVQCQNRWRRFIDSSPLVPPSR